LFIASPKAFSSAAELSGSDLLNGRKLKRPEFSSCA